MTSILSRVNIPTIVKVSKQKCFHPVLSSIQTLQSPGTEHAPLAPTAGILSRLCHKVAGAPEQEIYRGILSTQIKLVKSFSLTTSMIGP